MKFTAKISGTSVTDFQVKPILTKQMFSLSELIELKLSQRVMDWILDNLRFTRGSEQPDGKIDWYAMIDYDSITKLSILENYPEYEKELIEYFGESWMNQYLRFGH